MKTQSLKLLIALWCCAGFSAIATVRYVDQNSSNPLPPFTDWSTAATNIQDAIDAADPGDQILVTNGVFQTGGKVTYSSFHGELTNRVAADKPVTIESVNGPEVTIIQGSSPLGPAAVRGVYLTNGAALIGFTVTNGSTMTSFISELLVDRIYLCSGGGIFCEDLSATVSNCIIVGNSGEYGFGGMGGGIYSGTLNNCLIKSNQAVLGGGVFGSTLTDCTLVGNHAWSDPLLTGASAVSSSGGGAQNATLTNCILNANVASTFGGGAASGTLVQCAIQGNSSVNGGGLYSCTGFNDTISRNSAYNQGGGSHSGTLSNCTLKANAAITGGGAYSGTLNSCRLFDNISLGNGGGANSSKLNSCVLSGNSAVTNGGGVYSGTLNNCTVAGNSAPAGGGAAVATLTNCIVYFNAADSGTNFSGGFLSYCCTTPLPGTGSGNVTSDPQLADLFHLTAGSPCRAAGTSTASIGVDVDGEVWLNPPSIGCDEYYAGSITGALTVTIQSDYANARPGFPVAFTARIDGHASASSWNFGDGSLADPEPYTSHSWSSSGNYAITLIAFNEDHPGGVSNSVTVHVLDQPILYVAQSATNPVAPFTSWATAATNIQDAVDVAFAGGTTILVSNGVYRIGGRSVTGVLTNRVCISKPMTVQSVNGPELTVIEGYRLPGTLVGDSAVRCAYLCDGSSLTGFTLTNGATRAGFPFSQYETSGGGAWCQSTNATLSNCSIVSNTCTIWGGGAYAGTLDHCAFIHNQNLRTSFPGGGGAAFSVVFNSTIRSNHSLLNNGGGAYSCLLSNCVVTDNDDIGALVCVLKNCLVNGNAGKGISGGVADGCIISSNIARSANFNGGGAQQATLTGCILYGNQATNGGGAFNCSLNSCVLSNNVAALVGGGLYMDGIATNGLAGNNLFLNNSAGTHGGGFYTAKSATYVLTNWTFTGNSAKKDGGGLNSAAGAQILWGCIFAGNSAGGNGGGANGPSVPATNCTFAGNSAGTNGGAIYSPLGTVTSCLISSNSAALSGGGVWGGSLSFCSVIGNSAGGNGGGTSLSTVSRCLISGNRASLNGGGSAGATVSVSLLTSNLAGFGGGVYSATLNNCTLTGNVATNTGGGIYSPLGTVTSCIIYSNTAPTGSNYSNVPAFTSCCTTPLPPGTGNLTNNPVFIDTASGNFRLQTNSPCIDAGSGSPGTTDLDGRPRVVGAKIDIGAYEFQGPGIGEFTAWLQLWGLPVNGSADFTDADTDGLNNWQEWIAGTIPTNSSSILKLLNPSPAPSGVTVTWQSVSGRTYFLQRAPDLTAQSPFSTIQSNIVGQAGVTSFLDTGATGASPFFYRVGVQ